MAPSPDTRSSYGDRVYSTLRRELLDGTIRPGARLLEAEIAQRLQVSRTPVREALRRLESDGLVQRVGPNRLVVTPMGPDDLGDIGLLRIEIDGLSARLAVSRATIRDWDHIRNLVDQLALADPEGSEAAAVHVSVHRAIYQVGFGPRLSTFIDNHVLPYLEVAVTTGARQATAASSHRSHLALLRALTSGDADRAVSAAREHALAGLRAARSSAHN